MINVLLVLIVFSAFADGQQCKCGIERIDQRIIGGRRAPEGRYPWMVGLAITADDEEISYCGGSLINDRYVLTAAHCFQVPKPELTNVTLGAHRLSALTGKTSMAIEKVIVHSDYNPKGGHTNDIALVKLKSPVKFSDSVYPVCMASQYTPINNLFLTGWGINLPVKQGGDMSKELNEIVLPVIDDATCQREWTYRNTKVDIAKQLCGGLKGKSSCQGDSGGPLSTRTAGRVYQVGLVSYGPADCGANSGKPSVFTRVSAYHEWIASNTKDGQYCF